MLMVVKTNTNVNHTSDNKPEKYNDRLNTNVQDVTKINVIMLICWKIIWRNILDRLISDKEYFVNSSARGNLTFKTNKSRLKINTEIRDIVVGLTESVPVLCLWRSIDKNN